MLFAPYSMHSKLQNAVHTLQHAQQVTECYSYLTACTTSSAMLFVPYIMLNKFLKFVCTLQHAQQVPECCLYTVQYLTVCTTSYRMLFVPYGMQYKLRNAVCTLLYIMLHNKFQNAACTLQQAQHVPECCLHLNKACLKSFGMLFKGWKFAHFCSFAQNCSYYWAIVSYSLKSLFKRRVTVRESLSSLLTKEQPWAICSGRSWATVSKLQVIWSWFEWIALKNVFFVCFWQFSHFYAQERSAPVTLHSATLF